MKFAGNFKISQTHLKHELDYLTILSWNDSTKSNDIDLPNINVVFTKLRNILTNQMYTELTIMGPILLQWWSEKHIPERDEIIRLLNSFKSPLNVMLTHGNPFCFVEEVVNSKILQAIDEVYGPQITSASEKSEELAMRVVRKVEQIYSNTLNVDYKHVNSVMTHVQEIMNDELYQLIQDFYSFQMHHMLEMRELFKMMVRDESVMVALDKEFDSHLCGMFYDALWVKHGNVPYIQHHKNSYDAAFTLKKLAGRSETSFPANLVSLAKVA